MTTTDMSDTIGRQRNLVALQNLYYLYKEYSTIPYYLGLAGMILLLVSLLLVG